MLFKGSILHKVLIWMDPNARKEERIRKAVPGYCYYCDLLGHCRDEQNGWKCRRGCLMLKKRHR